MESIRNALLQVFFEILDDQSEILDSLINPEDSSKNLICRFNDTIFVFLPLVHHITVRRHYTSDFYVKQIRSFHSIGISPELIFYYPRGLSIENATIPEQVSKSISFMEQLQ